MMPRRPLPPLVALAFLLAAPAFAQSPPQPQPPQQQAPGGGCSDCPPPCPGFEQGGSQQDVTAPSLEFFQPQSKFGGGQTLIAGLPNDAVLEMSNPLRASFTGAFDLVPRGATLNVTHLDATLAPGEKRLVMVRITPQADQFGFNVQGRVMGTAGGVALCTQVNVGTQVAPPVSIDWVSPAPDHAMATLESLTLKNGGGFGGGDLALGSARAIQVRATNHANAASKAFYVFARVNDATLAPVTVPALAPSASTTLDLGSIPPPPADCNGPVSKQGCGGGTFLSINWATKPDATNGPNAVSFTPIEGIVTRTTALALDVVDPGDIAPVLEGAATGALGRLYVVTLNVTNFGQATSVNAPIRVAFVPPFRAQYDVQGEESASFLLTTAPGATNARSVSFTPLISGRWEMLVSFVPTGDVCCAVNAFTVDVAGPVNVSVPSSSVPIVAIGDAARTPILVHSDARIDAATLRITTAPQAAGDREGPPSASATQAVLGGLSQTLVKAEPTSVPLGTLAPGADVWSNVTVTARASGVYNVVPYVVAGGYAYTGTPLAQDQASSAAPPPFTPQFTIAFKATRIPLALAWAPALVVLLLGAGLFVGRRTWIK